MLKSNKVRVLAIAVALMGAMGAVAIPAQARSAKCFATPVPGQPGVEIVTCTTTRP
ncbi:MAG TPA: hypothetical protein VI319_14600 [Burkholderiales bacterium]